MYLPSAKVDTMPTANVSANAASVSSAELLYGMMIDSCYQFRSGGSRESTFIVAAQLDMDCPACAAHCVHTISARMTSRVATETTRLGRSVILVMARQGLAWQI
jgi:hypothetical protein